MAAEMWLTGPVDGIAPIFQPAAHALLQARAEVEELAPGLTVEQLWPSGRTGATAGFHLLHLAGALDRLFTYARGEVLNDAQKTAARAEAQPHPELTGPALAALIAEQVDRALVQLRRTDAATAFDAVRIGRAGLPSTVLGCLFHGAEHSARHAGQFISTVKCGAWR